MKQRASFYQFTERLGLALATAILSAGLAFAKPPLSSEVARLIENHGVDATRERFAELWAESAADYEADVEGLADLGTRYLQEGDIEAGMAVMEMVSIISLAELDTALQSQAALMAEMEAAAAEIAAKNSARVEAAPGDESPAPAAPDSGLASPMQRRGPLPGDWPRCLPDSVDAN